MRRVRVCIVLLSLAAIALSAPAAHAADRYKRSFRWSGYTWSVRTTTQHANPGHNLWGDTPFNVRVRADKTLRVNISKGKSVEVVGPRTGYGRYRWVVDSDLSGVDPFRVVAFFVRGTRAEQDIEFSRWGAPTLTTAGSWVTWRMNKRLAFDFFPVPVGGPYTIVIDWKVGVTHYSVRDAAGTVLLDTTYATQSGGDHIAPRISYWLYPGHGANRSPFTDKSVHPPIIVKSFRYTKLAGR